MQYPQRNKEFHPDNDPGGLKWAVLQKEFDGFNTGNLTSETEFQIVLNKAKRLVTQREEGTVTETLPNDTTIAPTTPKVRVDSKLSSEEQRVLKQLDWSEERYLKVKLAQPDFVRTLLNTK